MPRYRAHASYIVGVTYTFEAKDDDDARRIVMESDGSDYKETGESCDWREEGLQNLETREWVDEP